MTCTQCGKPMRGYGVKSADAPGTVPRGSGDVCMTCVNHRGGKPAEAPPSDEPCVIVKVNMRPSTYRAFADHAKALHVDVGELLSRLADRAVRREVTPRRRRAGTEDDIDARIRELNAQRLSDSSIAKIIGMSQAATSSRRRRLGLQSPTPRHGGRQKAA